MCFRSLILKAENLAHVTPPFYNCDTRSKLKKKLNDQQCLLPQGERFASSHILHVPFSGIMDTCDHSFCVFIPIVRVQLLKLEIYVDVSL